MKATAGAGLQGGLRRGRIPARRRQRAGRQTNRAAARLFRAAFAAATGRFCLFLFYHHPGFTAGRAFFGLASAFRGFAAFVAFKNSHSGLLLD